MKVSIIVPCYNAAVFLRQTVKSMQTQTYKDIEIILVNDCSTDSSLSIMRDLANQDPRIIIVDKPKNEGEDYARFSGIEVATGDYLTFLDADDWLAPNAVQTWVDVATKYKVDIVYTSMVRVFSQKLKIYRKKSLDIKILDRVISGSEKDELFISFFGVNIVPVNMCGNFFKGTLFDNSLEKSGLKFGADLSLGMQVYQKATSIYITNGYIYYYRWGGVTAKYQPKFIESVRSMFDRKIQTIEKLGLIKERRSAIIELVNCLATEVLQLAEYFPKRTEENLTILQKEFSQPCYSHFSEIASDPYFKDSALNTVCMNLDYKNAYTLAKNQMRLPKARLRHILKKVSSQLLKVVKL